MFRLYKKTGKVLKSAVSLVAAAAVVCLSFAGTVNAGYREGATNLEVNKPTGDPVYYYEPVVDENGNTDYFHYPIYKDPQDISDEEFFGVWDENGRMWVNKPYFRYSEFPDMKDVETAAKNGDYLTAKEELLNYYKSVAPQRVSISAALGETAAYNARNMLESAARNVYPTNFISGMNMGVHRIPYNSDTNPENWEEVSIDATTVFKTAVKSYALFNVMFCSVDKYYTQVEICSKESDYAPVLVVKANGVDVECPVAKDFTMHGGKNADVNYGSDEILTMEEHGGFQISTDDTARSMIIFDISSVPSDATISSAIIKVRARTNQERYPKEVSLLWYKDTSFVEDVVTWNTITDWLWWSYNDTEAWDYVTSNKPAVKGKPGWHRQEDPNHLKRGYEAYKDERYAYAYIRHQMALINGIGFSADVMNSLDLSTSVTTLTDGMIRCIESQYMTADAFTAMLKWCWLADNWQVTSYFGTATNNWATFASGAVYNLIARFPELAVYDEWLEKVRAEDARVIGSATFEDGMCIELSVNYVNTILTTYSTPIATSRATGAELPLDDATMTQIYDTLKSLMYMKGPYGGFNLADGYDTYSNQTSTYKTWYQYELFDDDMLEYLATDGAKGRMPENPTTRYWAGERTYIRAGWGEKDTMLSFTNNNKANASHGHADALSVVLFAYGKCLLTDQGYGSIQTGGKWEYNRSPVQHNLVTVNDIEDWLTEGTSKSASTLPKGDGYSLGFEANMQYDFAEYGTELYTTNKKAQRSVMFVRDANFFIVSDYVVPNDETVGNLYAQHWHMYPGAKFSYDENNYTIRTNFEDDVNLKIVPVEYDEIDEIRRVGTLYSEAPGQSQDSEKAMILKTKTGSGRFTTVLMPLNVDDDIDVETSVIKTSYNPDLVNAATILVRNNSTGATDTYYYFHLNDESQKRDSVSLGDFSTDATTVLIRKNSAGNVVSAFMMNGSFIKDKNLKGKYIIKTKDKVESVSFRTAGATLNVASTTMSDEEVKDMTVYSYGASDVFYTSGEWDVLCEMTGNTLDSKKKGGYFYFGENPVLDVEDDPDDGKTEEPAERPGAITGGGGGGGGAAVKPSEPDKPSNPDTPVTPTEPSKPSDYKDVSKSDWYFDAVKELTEAGVVSGDGDGNFGPKEKVTREQFLKMLLAAADTEIGSGINVFDDVVSDSWYAPYVTAARTLGIANGISETKFGVGMNITRQDMAVLLERLIKKVSPEILDGLTPSDGEFEDANEVSDYARNAVSLMQKAGLIKGYENKFRPCDTLTRAEAATVIDNFYKIFNK